MSAPEHLDGEPDIVQAILQLVREVTPLTLEQAAAVEAKAREQYGGLRTRIAKRKKHPSAAARRKVFQEALTDAPTEQILAENGISRRSLYRYLKRGGE